MLSAARRQTAVRKYSRPSVSWWKFRISSRCIRIAVIGSTGYIRTPLSFLKIWRRWLKVRLRILGSGARSLSPSARYSRRLIMRSLRPRTWPKYSSTWASTMRSISKISQHTRVCGTKTSVNSLPKCASYCATKATREWQAKAGQPAKILMTSWAKIFPQQPVLCGRKVRKKLLTIYSNTWRMFSQ